MPKKKYEDWIKISGAPNVWGVHLTLEKLLSSLRSLKLLAKEPVVLSVSFVDEKSMEKLNWIHRKKRSSTDVLSFEQPIARGNVGKLRFLGDIVLCIPVVRMQANQQKHGIKDEITVLLTHGLLHLLGYDHERSEKEFMRMTKAEERILKRSGYALDSGLIARAVLEK